MLEKVKKEELRRFLVYFAYTIVFFLLIILGNEYGYYRLQYPGSKYLGMLFLGKPIVFFTLQVYHLLIGLMLALPRLISARRRPGNWKFDWVVFIAVCVPALYVTLTPWAPTFLWSYWPFFNLISSTRVIVALKTLNRLVMLVTVALR